MTTATQEGLDKQQLFRNAVQQAFRAEYGWSLGVCFAVRTSSILRESEERWRQVLVEACKIFVMTSQDARYRALVNSYDLNQDTAFTQFYSTCGVELRLHCQLSDEALFLHLTNYYGVQQRRLTGTPFCRGKITF